MTSEFLKTIFNQTDVEFRSIDLISSAKSPVLSMFRQSQIDCSIWECEDEFFIALNPSTNEFDLSRLNKAIGKKLLKVEKEGKQQLNDLLKNTKKNLNHNIHIFIDEALEYHDELYLVDSGEKHVYAIDVEQLHKLSSDKLIGISFSEEISTNNMDIKETLSFKERVKALHSLPPMPETASQVLNLRSIPDVKVEQIVEVIEKDPVLVAQIVSYANSAFFGQAGSVKSLKDAIFRVLGVDAVMNMALALSVGSTFKMPKAGPIGAKSVWQSSIYTASLMQRLSMLMPWGERPNPGTAYLVGLLHDIGLLVIGHLFTDEYAELNEYLEKNKDVDILTAEQKILGISHIEVGKMVMRMWNMPEELVTVATYFDEKHSPDEHENYIELLTVVKSLLVPHGLAFGKASEEVSADLLEKLCIDEEDMIIAADEVLSEGDIIKNLVKQMCA